MFKFPNRRVLRSMFTSVLVAVAAPSLVLSAAPSAEARVISSAGQTTTTYVIYRPECWNRPVWRQLELKAPVPTIYAVNARVGAGNDLQYVRYAVHVYDMMTNSYVAASNFSAAVLANDNRPASFSGSWVSFKVPSVGRYRLVYQLEWFSPQTGAVSGRLYDSVEYYNYFNQYQAGPIGPMDSCMNNG